MSPNVDASATVAKGKRFPSWTTTDVVVVVVDGQVVVCAEAADNTSEPFRAIWGYFQSSSSTNTATNNNVNITFKKHYSRLPKAADATTSLLSVNKLSKQQQLQQYNNHRHDMMSQSLLKSKIIQPLVQILAAG